MKCTNCGIRWPQKGGLCRTCDREAGDTRTTFERERDKVFRDERNAARRGIPPPPGMPPPREITVHGIDYLVIWDGSNGANIGERRWPPAEHR